MIKKFFALIVKHYAISYDDNWSHIIYDENFDHLLNKAQKFLGCNGYDNINAIDLVTFECLEIDGKLYGELIISDDIQDVKNKIENFDLGYNQLPANIRFTKYLSDKQKNDLLYKEMSSNVYLKEFADYKERLRLQEEKEKNRMRDYRDDQDRKKFEELKKKFG
jgi:hypothetical protein